MRTDRVTKAQVTALQTLFTSLAHRTLLDSDPGDHRQFRLDWLSRHCGRLIYSTKDLTISEAASAIDALQVTLGREPRSRPTNSRLGRDAAMAAGTHGRRGFQTNELAMASEADHGRINEAVRQLGWDRDRYHAWLSSRTSPLGGDREIRTVAQANRVWWALKRMIKAARKAAA